MTNFINTYYIVIYALFFNLLFILFRAKDIFKFYKNSILFDYVYAFETITMPECVKVKESHIFKEEFFKKYYVAEDTSEITSKMDIAIIRLFHEYIRSLGYDSKIVSQYTTNYYFNISDYFNVRDESFSKYDAKIENYHIASNQLIYVKIESERALNYNNELMIRYYKEADLKTDFLIDLKNENIVYDYFIEWISLDNNKI